MTEVETITMTELTSLAQRMYQNLVKGVVDVERQVLVVDMELHVDGEQHLLERGSKQVDLWGINLHPAQFGSDDFIEFDSMINIRPSQRNLTRGVEDESIRVRIRAVIDAKVKP